MDWIKIAIEGGPVVLSLVIIILLVLFLRESMRKERDKKSCVDSDCMKNVHQNSIHNREVLDTLISKMDTQVKESVKQTTLLKIIARNGKGHLIDL